MDKINFLIKLCDNSFFAKKALCIFLELRNEGDKDVYINSDSLLIDGFTSSKFKFSNADSNTTFEVIYKGPNIKYLPQKILLKAGTKLTSELDLNEAYDFINEPASGGVIINYDSHIRYCSEDNKCTVDQLHGELHLMLGEIEYGQ